MLNYLFVSSLICLKFLYSPYNTIFTSFVDNVVFVIMIIIVFQSIFYFEIYQNNIFYFLKFIFDIVY
jgi:hypothetical protein